MAHILIDGYNLTGIAHEDLQQTREAIIAQLQEYARIKKHEITIVFDGWKSGQKNQTRIKTRHVTIIYSRLGENADVVIKKILSSTTKPWIVVSSDREVSDFAFKRDFAAVHSEEFEFKMHLCLHDYHSNMADEEMSLDDEFMKYHEDETESRPSRSGGNPRKMSRRQKIKMKALKKL